MKYLPLVLAAASSAALFATGNVSTATAEVGVKIISPVVIVNPGNTKLDFGMVTVDNDTQPIQVTFSPNGAKSYTNCEAYPGSNLGSLAWFHVRKDHELGWGNVNITVPATVNLGNPDVNVATERGAMDPCFTYLGLPLLLNNTVLGVDLGHFYVGGTLTAGAGVYGAFSGTMTVTANYQ